MLGLSAVIAFMLLANPPFVARKEVRLSFSCPPMPVEEWNSVATLDSLALIRNNVQFSAPLRMTASSRRRCP